MSNHHEIIPFGKYKGQPLEVLQQDKGYCDWLMAQDWLQSRFPELRTLIINNFAEPTETPEHNALQARFLEDAFVIAATMLFYGGKDHFPSGSAQEMKGRIPVSFEQDGADVVIGRGESYRGAGDSGIRINLTVTKQNDPVLFDARFNDKKEALTGTIEHAAKYGWPSGEELEATERALDRLTNDGVLSFVFRIGKIGVELKPSMGDDYPAVIRQIRAMNTKSRALVLGAYTGVGATLDQVRAMFAACDITVILVSEIEDLAATL